MYRIICEIDRVASGLGSLALFLLLVKWAANHVGPQKLSELLKKWHKPVVFVVIIGGIVHMFTSFVFMNVADVFPYIFGSMSILSIGATALTFYKKKSLGLRWIVWHRIFAMITIIVIVVHLIV